MLNKARLCVDVYKLPSRLQCGERKANYTKETCIKNSEL